MIDFSLVRCCRLIPPTPSMKMGSIVDFRTNQLNSISLDRCRSDVLIQRYEADRDVDRSILPDTSARAVMLNSVGERAFDHLQNDLEDARRLVRQ